MNSIFFISGTITFSHSIGKKMKHRYQSFTRIGCQFQSLKRQVYADWTLVSFPLLPKELPYMAINNEYTDKYNDEYLCRDSFVGFNFWSRLSFQISEFRVHWTRLNIHIKLYCVAFVLKRSINILRKMRKRRWDARQFLWSVRFRYIYGNL